MQRKLHSAAHPRISTSSIWLTEIRGRQRQNLGDAYVCFTYAWFVDCWKSRQNERAKRKKTERERRCINNDGERHCISRGLVRVHDSYRQTMFYSPVAFSQRTGEYQDRPSPVNNQIRGVRKSLSCSRKRHRWRGQARRQGAEERTEEKYRRSSLRTIAVPRCSIRTFTRRCSSDMLAPISNSKERIQV